MAARQVRLGEITFANDSAFVLLGGVNVLEDLGDQQREDRRVLPRLELGVMLVLI